MNPADLAAVRLRVEDMDAEGAARELALALRLDRDAEMALGEIIREAFRAGQYQAQVEYDKMWSEEDWA